MFSIPTRLRSALICAVSLLATASLAQTTINVGPGQPYATIQSGIDAAANGDTVLVAPGTYHENIRFNGKAITLTSSGGAAVTFIDGGSQGGLATVVFANGETSTSVISNFTIRGGGDTIFNGTSDGGIFVNEASPIIQNNIVTGNYCHNIDVEFGAATILNNEISGVLQDTQGTQGESYCTFGSGLHLQGTVNPQAPGSIVIGNTIEKNYTGSAINIWAAQNVLISDNTIRDNTSPDPGSAFTSANSEGTVLFQNLIYKNSSTCGGAIGFMDDGTSAASPTILIANNTIVDNATPQILSGSECIAISQIYPGPYSYGSSGPGAVFINNIISGSTSYPAVNCSWFEAPSQSLQPTFENNILYNAAGPFFGSYCIDVSGKYNNIIADPQFVSPSTGDYHLKSTSPAIDTGENGALQTLLTMTGRNFSTDFDGNPRVQNATGKGCIIDMGAYESPGTQSICATAETLTSSPNPSAFGQTVTFTAQLSSASGVPTGDVQFNDGTTLLAAEAISSAGVSTFSTSQLSVGSHNITAAYQPTGSFTAASASVTQVIDGYPTTAALTCSPASIYISQTAQLAALVTSANGTPTGSITFTDNGTALSTQTLSTGTASLTYSAPAAGVHALTATYTPTGAFAGSSASCSETVTALPSTSVLSVTPPTSTFGSPVTLTATVSPGNSFGTSTPTGTITFYDGGSNLGTATLANGAASLTLSTLPAGSDSLSCTYSGSAVYATSSCNTVPLVVNAAPTALTLTSSNNPATALTPVTFTATLSANGKPVGAGNTITLSLNGQTIDLITNAAGSAAYTINTLTPNTYPVTANFPATSSLLASAASLTQTVNSAPTATGLTVAPNPGYAGQLVTVTATVTAQGTSAQPNSGTVTFFDGAASLGTQPVSASGVATLSISTLAAGIHPISASFNPPNNTFLTSTSPVINEQILASGFTIALAPSSISFRDGASATVAIHLASVGNFSGPLSLTYGTLPGNAAASINPATVTLTAGGTASSTLTIDTLLKASTRVPNRPGSRELPVALATFALLLIPARRRRPLARLLGLALLACALQTITGCTNSWYTAAAVAPGTYQLPVIATDINHNAQTATLTITVTPNP